MSRLFFGAGLGLNGGSRGGFTPSILPDLKLWLAADRISGLVDGDPVTTWSDLSGQGNNATQGTGAAKPTFKTSILNGRSVVRFDGVDDILLSTGVVSGFAAQDQPFTVLSVFQPSSLAATRTIWGLGKSASANPSLWYRVLTTYQGRLIDDAGLTKNFPTAGSPAPTTSSAVVTTLMTTGASGTHYVNGTSLNTATDVDVSTTTFTHMSIGALSTTVPSNFFVGDIAEVIVYTRALTDAERRRVERYLGAKWAVTVA